MAAAATPKASAPPKKRSTTRRLYTAKTYPIWFVVSAAVLFVFFFFVPTLASFYFAFTRWDLQQATWIGWRNFEQFFAEPQLKDGLVHTIIYAFVTSGAKVIIALLLGAAHLQDHRSRAGPFDHLLPSAGQHDRRWHHVQAGILAIPREYYEAAEVDGTGRFKQFVHITVLTVVSVTFMVLFGAMTAFIWQRRAGRIGMVIQFMVLAGLVIPPAVVPTVWVLQSLGLFKTMPGLMLIEITFHMSFCVLLFRGFVATIPREIDEAAIVDGAGPLKLSSRSCSPSSSR